MKKKKYTFTKKLLHLGLAVVLIGALVLPSISSKHVAAAEVTSRSIEMSDANAGDTNVTYLANFDVATTADIEGMVIDFCSNDPLIADTCTAPAGFSLGASPSATTNASGTWAASTNGSAPYSTLFMTNSSGTTLTSGQDVTITISDVTNPSAVNTPFYARILTFTSSATALSYTAGNGEYADSTDSGGLALSTVAPISVTARVMETLTFCVYHTTCGDSPALNIGHGADTILDSTAVDTGTDDFSIATNASEGANITMKGGTLTSGSNTIPAVNGGSATPAAINAGVAAFGMYVFTSGTDISPTTTYAGSGGDYGLNLTNLSSTYGDTIATLSGPVNSSITTLQFGATASNTTPAGIYTASEELIATATF